MHIPDKREDFEVRKEGLVISLKNDSVTERSFKKGDHIKIKLRYNIRDTVSGSSTFSDVSVYKNMKPVKGKGEKEFVRIY